MKHLALAAVTVVLLMTPWEPGAEAQGAFECIQTNRCQSPPPCEFMAELEHARASMRAAAKMIAADDWATEIQLGKDLSKAMDKYLLECPAFQKEREELDRVRVWSPAPECGFGVADASGKYRPAGLQTFKDARNTCSEIVEAQFAMQGVKQHACLTRAQGLGPDTAVESHMSEVSAQYEKVRSLEASLRKYVMSCVPPADLARELSRLGLDALEDKPQAAYNEWWAQRALAEGRR